MDCCNYPEYRAQYGWESAPAYAPYAPLPYAPYAPSYYAPHAHDPYARYAATAYHYDSYATQHTAPNDHVTPMDYGVYSSKDGRARRPLGRRDVRARTPTHHLPLPSTPPLECGLNGRSGGYCEPQMWQHYQGGGIMGVGGWGGGSSFANTWMSRGPAACAREHLRLPPDMSRPMKGSHLHTHNQVCPSEERSTPFPVYQNPHFLPERSGTVSDFASANTPTSVASTEPCLVSRERSYPEMRRPTPEEKRQPTTVPLPAFQQAFGSTEIGRFAEAFSRTEVALDDASSDTFNFDGFSDWDGHPEPLWSSQPAAREIKCEENY